MTTTPRTCRRSLAQLLEDAIGLYVENRENYIDDYDGAIAAAVAEVLEGAAVRCADLGREPCSDCQAETAQRELIAALAGALQKIADGASEHSEADWLVALDKDLIDEARAALALATQRA